jgi:hypothetical protein
MTGKYPRKTNVNFLYEDFSILKLGEYLQVLIINTCEQMNTRLIGLRGSCVEPADQNCDNAHEEPREIFLQRNGEKRLRITKMARGHKKEMNMDNGGGRGRQRRQINISTDTFRLNNETDVL